MDFFFILLRKVKSLHPSIIVNLFSQRKSDMDWFQCVILIKIKEVTSDKSDREA